MEERFAFLAEWYDPSASLVRRYKLLFYPRDGSVEMFDVKNQRTFLRRTKCDDLKEEDIFVGNRVNVFSRQLSLIGYGDQHTASKLGSKKERTLALIKPDAVTKIGDIIQMILDENLMVTKAKMTKLSWTQAGDFYSEHQSKSFFNNLIQFVTSGPVVALEVMGDEAVSTWRKILGPTDSVSARGDASGSLRARFGTDGTRNAAHGSDSLASAARELEFFFPSTTGNGPANTAKCEECTCCIIKPHAISEGLTGKILTSITQAGFQISALQMFSLDRATAEEFLEVYKGVVEEYLNMVSELSSGPCMALEIRGTETSRTFREYCGPADPELARHLRPDTLRARFGRNRVQNGVHCSDLPEDSVLEVQYFFKILDG
ncbi:hypothetical protein COCON_G00200610 [Conger conger]|uniref:Nucleoside diphosphate kinase homolog 7 n=1 Tax=Conger conger TaxID=82655 RepID=A0A9Q1D2E2_CONCO|nr:nucleoside diphosphate kinase 7 isoform X2 [Conger conger]KAJ8256197.1 hypothetical protein COCON_G00200610 [Conger conger]